MPNEPSGDIQIKPVGSPAAQSASAAGQSAVPAPAVAGGNAATAANPAAQAPVTPVPAAAPIVLDAAAPAAATTVASSTTPAAPSTTPVATTTTAPTPAPAVQPVNKRAFNLEEGVAEAASGPAKPEKFAIPKMVREKYPDLIELIKVTESMDDQERQYWFQIMPVMTPEQIEKFRNILVTEKQQLANLDKEYEDELNKLNEKHLLEWKEFETKEKSKAIKEAEAKSSEEEKKMEEDLLAKLSNV